MNKKKKIRVNISVDENLLEKAKEKLGMFGGKLSTLFNAYLSDFVTSIEKNYSKNKKELEKKVDELEEKLKIIEGKLSEKKRKIYK